MGILAETLSLQLKEKGIKHSVHGDNKEGIMMAQQLPNVKIPVTILFLTDDKSSSVSIRFYNLYKMEDDEINGNLFFLLNQMNLRYRWGKVILDEKDIVLAMDAMVTPFSITETCIQMAVYGAQMADEIYSSLEQLKNKL